MTRITIIGGSGYAGRHLVAAAAQRGHHVTSISRSLPAEQIDGVSYVEDDVLSDGALRRAVQDAEVVVSALSPRGRLAGRTRQVLTDLAAEVAARRIRLGVIGGAGTLRVGADGPLVKDTNDFPAEFKDEAEEMGDVLDDLRHADADLDWFYVSPAAGFGPWAPGTATRVYRIGGDQLLVDDEGRSEVSGSDLADAVLNEIEKPEHSRTRFSVAY